MMNKPVALVTGSTRGIGFAIATRLLKEGNFVIFNGVSRPELPRDALELIRSLGRTLGVDFTHVKADVSAVEGRRALIDVVTKELGGRIDYLVNNSGIAPRERLDLLEMSVESYRRVMTVNLEGPFFLTREISKLMLELLESRQIVEYAPCIINISSISSYTSTISRGEYCISKAGISMMTALFADRLGGKIPVHEIRPGIIQTDMTRGVLKKYEGMIKAGLLPIDRIGKPSDVAEAVLAIINNGFPYSTGNVFDVDGGFHLRRL
ncbi:MAG: 3-ketoacyl-ACP reductase [Promethearchaeota archaeon]